MDGNADGATLGTDDGVLDGERLGISDGIELGVEEGACVTESRDMSELLTEHT